MKEEILKLIDDYWRFDVNQQPNSSWHEKQALMDKIRDRAMPTDESIMKASLEFSDDTLEQAAFRHHVKFFRLCL